MQQQRVTLNAEIVRVFGYFALIIAAAYCALFIANIRARFHYGASDLSFLGWIAANAVIAGWGTVRLKRWGAVMLADVISPFSRGGFVSSDLFDHTSILRFLEARFGAEVPNLSAWRRATVGDLTSSFNFAVPDYSVPNLPSTAPGIPEIIQECAANLAGTTPYPVPNPQSLPSQEVGTPHSPSGRC